MSQKPAINSLVSVKGPSTTVRLLPENLTRAPFELGWRPSAARSTPAFASSSLYLAIAAKMLSSGGSPASLSLFALTRIMNRIALTPCPHRCTSGLRFLLRNQSPSLRSLLVTCGLIDDEDNA